MLKIDFPRDVVWVGGCCAIAHPRSGHKLKALDAGRYRHVKLDGETWGGHRLSYHLNIGKIPCRPANLREGLVLHTCDNKWCINPNHLYLGTQSQNIKDAMERNTAYRALLATMKRTGHPHTEASRAKIGLANKGQRRTPEQRARMSDGQRGRKHTPESKAKISAAFARRREQSA